MMGNFLKLRYTSIRNKVPFVLCRIIYIQREMLKVVGSRSFNKRLIGYLHTYIVFIHSLLYTIIGEILFVIILSY